MSGSRLSREVIDRAFAAHDADGDGLLDLKELEDMMRAASEEENRRRNRRGSKSKERAGKA